jgi:hypothetical protein
MPDRTPLTLDQIRDWLTEAYLHPNENWYTPVFDVRRRALFYLTTRHYALLDEPSSTPSAALERLFARFERWDLTIRRFRPMPDGERLRFVLKFIRAEPRAEVRDLLLARFSERTDVIYGWRPGSLEALVDGLSLDAPELAQVEEGYRQSLREECRVWVDLQLTIEPRLASGAVYSWSPW